MSDAASTALMSETEYVAFELTSLEKHEFVDGVIRAMSGASIRHNVVAGRLCRTIGETMEAGGCIVLMEGVRLKINERRHYYPDVIVTCEELTDTHAVSAPCFIAEVLSPTTSSIDRGEKRLVYLQMPSLRHLVLIDPEADQVEHLYRMDEDDPWRFEQLQAGDSLRLSCGPGATVDVGFVLDRA